MYKHPGGASTRPPNRPRTFSNWILAACAFIAALCVGYVAFSATTHRSPLDAFVQIAAPDPVSLFGKESIRVLVVGLDYDYDEKDQEYSTQSRSDIIMAIDLDFLHNKVNELSVPRDMVATMPDGQQAKINEAQSEGGIAESQKVVASWLGIPGFDRYVVLRIDTMKDLINAIGGVDVVVKNSDCLRYKTECKGGRIDYDDSWGHLHVHLTEGPHHLDGDQAVGYARFRHDWCSDPCRIMRQQQVIKSIVTRLKGDDLNTLTHIVPLIHVVNADIQTNFTTQEELGIAYALRDITPHDISTAQVPYTEDIDLPGYGDSIVADETAKQQLVQRMLSDATPAPSASP